MAEDDDFLAQFDVAKGLERANTVTGLVACPMCGNTEWIIEGREDETGTGILAPAFIVKDPRGHFGAVPSFPVAVYTCTACGFVRLHNLAWLLRDQSQEPDG